MSVINFTKMSGAGNDFILIDADDESTFSPAPGLIQKLCCRRNGIGADGLITLKKSDMHHFSMIYYNSDGHAGSLCGNGARCAIKFAHIKNKYSGRETQFLSNNKEYSGELIDNDIVRFYLNSPEKIKLGFKIKAAGQLITSAYADTGSPHIVIKCGDVLADVKNPLSGFSINSVPVMELGREIRYHNDFAPAGVNVNFIEIKDGKVFIRTYERGVEDETLACGTGSTAAALISSLTDGLKPPINLITKGGEILTVDFKYDKSNFYGVSLTGPAKVTFTGTFSIDSYL